ncbi:hypothetical protein PLESTF_001769600 [Pleodorina starrii]|nr:hypothetical protein PLESTF_001769600 [Pleodorina starrii]
MLKCLAADGWWAAYNLRPLARRFYSISTIPTMADKTNASRAELLQRLQALAQQASADDGLALPDLADQLAALANQMRMASHTSAAGPPSTSAAGPAAATITAMDAADGNPADGTPPVGQPSKKQRRAPREFDFSRYRTRLVALELMYVGWTFQGFARQDNTENTIEGVLFSALRKVKLVPEASAVPISELGYSRCGRTDRGVSALGQVVALRLRSIARVDEPAAPLESEYDYPRLINKALPPEVRVLGWAPVDQDFNARFSAQYREYKYFIVQQRLNGTTAAPTAPATTATAATAATAAGGGSHADAGAAAPGDHGAADADAAAGGAIAAAGEVSTSGRSGSGSGSGSGPQSGSGSGSSGSGDPPAFSLDIEAMRAAAALFVGEHDFRNFCKPDVATVRSFRRRILSFVIEPVTTSAGEGEGEGGHTVYALTVRGSAFLWHQVRCMAAVLLMVGRGQERPQVVSELLDVEAHPRKPQYSMAPEEPLLLYACGFRDLVFRRSPAAVEATLGDVGGLLHRHLVGAALTAACHCRLAADTRLPAEEGSAAPTAAHTGGGGSGRNGGGGGGGGGGGVMPHIPLMKRQTEPSIEERMARRGIPWPPEPRDGLGAAAEGMEGQGRGRGEGEEDDPMVE